MLGDVSFWQYALVAAVAFGSSVLGGMTGYGAGLLLPPLLVPIVGAEAVVPVMGVSALLTNSSRIVAFWSEIDRRKATIIIACATPTAVIGAYGYTLLTGPRITILIGAMLIVLVPIRQVLTRARGHLGERGTGAAAFAYGFLTGGTVGVGVILITILLSTGLHGSAVIATDAAITLAIAFTKAVVFQSTGFLPLSSWIMALLIGASATPGAFIAKRITARLSLKAHIAILDGVVVIGGVLLVLEGLGHL